MSQSQCQTNPRLPPRDFIAAEKFHIFDAPARGHARRLFIFFRQSGSSAGLAESARPYSCLFAAAAPTTEANNELTPQFHGDGASNIARFDEDGYSLLLQFVPDHFPDRAAVKNYTTKHRMTGVCEAFAILGFIRFLHDFHLFAVTHVEETAVIGTHPVMGVKSTKLILLNEDGRNQETMVRMSNRIEDLWSEEYKLKDAFLGVRPTAFCYCNSGLDLSRTIQSSCLSNAENPRKKYQWNNLYCAKYESALPILKDYRVFTRLIFGDVIQRRILVTSQSSGYNNNTSYMGVNSNNNSNLNSTASRGATSSSLLDRTGTFPSAHGAAFADQRGGGGTTVSASYQFSIITRRSRHFAGVRYLKRGITEEGRAANHVETEQVLIDENTDLNNPAINSYCQVRCSVPVLWYHEQVGAPKPPIYFGSNDANFTSTRNHFAELIEDFGTPILVFNLMQQNEKKRREEGLSDLYFKAVSTITAPFHNRKGNSKNRNTNSSKDEENALKVNESDNHHHHEYFRKQKGLNHNSNSNNDLLFQNATSGTSTWSNTNINYSNNLKFIKEVPPIIYQEYDFKKNVRTAWNVITGFAEKSVSMTNSFTLRSGVVTSMQRGVIRTNCVDCIDRTNVGQCFFATHIAEHQLMALAATTQPVSNVTTVRLRSMMLDMFQVLGDNIAQDYCGSETVSAGIDTGRGILWDKAMGVKRFYANKFSDDERQMSINYFLGLYNMKFRRAVTLTKCVCGRSLTGDGEDGNPADDVLRVGVDAYHDDPTALSHDATYYASKWKSSATNVAPTAGVRSLAQAHNNNTNDSAKSKRNNNNNSNSNNNNNDASAIASALPQKVQKTTYCLACAPKQLQRVEDDTAFFTSVKNFFSKASNEEYETNRNKTLTCDALVRPTKLENLNEIDYYLHIKRFRKPPTVREMTTTHEGESAPTTINQDHITNEKQKQNAELDHKSGDESGDESDDDEIVDGIPKFWWELPLKRFEQTNPLLVNPRNQNIFIGAPLSNNSANISISRGRSVEATTTRTATTSLEASRSGAVSISASTSDNNIAFNNNNSNNSNNGANNNNNNDESESSPNVENTSLNIEFNRPDNEDATSDIIAFPVLDACEQQKRMRITYSRSSAAWSARLRHMIEVHIEAADVIVLSKNLDRFEERINTIFSSHNNDHNNSSNNNINNCETGCDEINDTPTLFRVLPDETRDIHVHTAPYFEGLTNIKADPCLLVTDPRQYVANLYANSPSMQQELYWYGYEYYNLDYAVRANSNNNNNARPNNSSSSSQQQPVIPPLPPITPSTSAATIAYQQQLQELQQYFLLQQEEKKAAHHRNKNSNNNNNSNNDVHHDVFYEWDTQHDDACYFLASVSALGPVNEINCRKMLDMFNEWERYTEKHLCSAISTSERRKMSSIILQNSNNSIRSGNNNKNTDSPLLPSSSSSIDKNVGILSAKAINAIADLCSTLKPTKFVVDHLAAINIYGGLLHYNNLHYTQTTSSLPSTTNNNNSNHEASNISNANQRVSILPSTQPLFVAATHSAQFLSAQSGLVQSVMMLKDTEKLALKKWAQLVQQIKPPMSEHQAESVLRDTLTRSWGTTQDFFDELISDSNTVFNVGDASYRAALRCYNQFLHFGSGNRQGGLFSSSQHDNNNNSGGKKSLQINANINSSSSLHRQFSYHRLLNNYRQHPGFHRSVRSRYLAMHGMSNQFNMGNASSSSSSSSSAHGHKFHFTSGENDDLAPTVTKHGKLLVGSKDKDIHVHVAPELLWDDPTALRSHPLCFFMNRTPSSRAEFFNTLHHWVALAAAPQSEGGVPRFNRTRYDNDLTAKKAQKLPRGVILVCVFSLDELADWMIETYFKHYYHLNETTTDKTNAAKNTCCFTFRKGFPKRSVFVPLLNEVADAPPRLDPCLLRRQPCPLITKAAHELAALWVHYSLAVPVFGDEATKQPIPTVMLVNDPQQLYTLECFDEAIHRQDVASRAFRRLYRLQQYYQENQISIPMLDVFFSATTPFANDAEFLLEEFEQLRANAIRRMTIKRNAKMMRMSRKSSEPSSPSNNNSTSSKRRGNAAILPSLISSGQNKNSSNNKNSNYHNNKESSSSSSSDDDDIDEKYILSKHVDAAEEEEDEAFGYDNNNIINDINSAYVQFTNSLLDDESSPNNDSMTMPDATDLAITLATSSSPNKLPIAGAGGAAASPSAPSSPKLMLPASNRNLSNVSAGPSPQLALRNKRLADVRFFAETQSHVSCTMWSHTAAKKYLLNQTESKIDDLSRLATVSLEYIDPVARCVVLVNTFNAIYAMVTTKLLSLNPSLLTDSDHPQELVFSTKSWAAGRLLRRFGFSFGGVYFTLSDIKHGLLRGNRPPPGHILPPFGLDDDDVGDNEAALDGDFFQDHPRTADNNGGDAEADEHHIRGDRFFKPPNKAGQTVENADVSANHEAWLRRKKRMLVPTSVVRQDPRWVLLLADILVENVGVDVDDAEATAASIAAATAGHHHHHLHHSSPASATTARRGSANANDADEDDGDDFAPVISTGEHLTSLSKSNNNNKKKSNINNNDKKNGNNNNTSSKPSGLSFAAILKNLWASASHVGDSTGKDANNSNNNQKQPGSSNSPSQPRKRMVGFALNGGGNAADENDGDDDNDTYEDEADDENNKGRNLINFDEEDYQSAAAAITCVAVDVDQAERLLKTQTKRVYKLLTMNFYSSKIDPNQSSGMTMSNFNSEGHNNVMNYYGTSGHHHDHHHNNYNHHDHDNNAASGSGGNNHNSKDNNILSSNINSNNYNNNSNVTTGGGTYVGGTPSPQAARVMAHLVSMPEFTGVDPDSLHRYRLNTVELQRNVMRTLEDLISHYGKN